MAPLSNDAMRIAVNALLRFLAVFVLLALLPTAAALTAAFVRPNSHISLAHLVFEADLGFAVSRFSLAALAAVAWSAALAAASLCAFRDRGVAGFVRVARIVGALWVAILLAYPGFGSWIPVVRGLPWVVGAALGLCALALLHAIKGVRLTWREALVTIAFVAVFLVNPSFVRSPARPSARPLTDRDVLVFGWDSLSHEETAATVAQFAPSRGTKTTFTNAWTPIAMTSIAWRSVLSGLYPGPENSLPGVEWPPPSSPWLPRELAHAGYAPVLYQDNPATNTYRPDENVAVQALQGWKSILNELAWKLVFPASTAGAPWWVAVFDGPADEPGRYGYDPRRIWNGIFDRIADAAERGPVFWASHICYGHAPVHLTIIEAAGIPGWWRLRPPELEGSGDAFVAGSAQGSPAIRDVRLRSVRKQILSVLQRLDERGALGSATVILLSDHAERGPHVPVEALNHVMLAAFTPGPRRDNIVAGPVSLADIAPTVRRALRLPYVHGDAPPLPLQGQEVDSHRIVPRFLAPTEASLGLAVGDLDVGRMKRGLHLSGDGTFHIDLDALRTAARPDVPSSGAERRRN